MENTLNNLTIKPINIYISYQDVDVAGVVYFANYFNYGEKARAVFLKETFGEINFLKGFAWAVKDIKARYLKPAKLGDTVVVNTVIDKINYASVLFKHIFVVNNMVIAEMDVLVLSIDSNLKPAKISKEILDVFKNFII